METYTEDEMDQALARVEEVKKIHPVGWDFLSELSLPGEELVLYAFVNATAHVQRLGQEEDRRVIYAAGWLNGIGVGVVLAEKRNPAEKS